MIFMHNFYWVRSTSEHIQLAQSFSNQHNSQVHAVLSSNEIIKRYCWTVCFSSAWCDRQVHPATLGSVQRQGTTEQGTLGAFLVSGMRRLHTSAAACGCGVRRRGGGLGNSGAMLHPVPTWGVQSRTRIPLAQANLCFHTWPGKALVAGAEKGVALPEDTHQSSGEVKDTSLGSRCHWLVSSIAFELRGGEMCCSSTWICSHSLLSLGSQARPLFRFQGQQARDLQTQPGCV